MILLLRSSQDFRIEDNEQKIYTLREARKLVLKGKITDCNLAFNRFINIKFDLIKRKTMKDILEAKIRYNYSFNTIREYTIIILLHEIKHAIDHKQNPISYMEEHWKAQNLMFNNNFTTEEYCSLPLEKSADNFAIKEINKWK